MKRRDLLTAAPILVLGRASASNQTQPSSSSEEAVFLFDAATLRSTRSVAGYLAEIGLKEGDQFGLLDGSRYEILAAGEADQDLPLPGDQLDQPLRVLPVRGQISMAAWGPTWVSPKRSLGIPSDTPDVSEMLSRAVQRAIATHAELLLPPGLFLVTRPGSLLPEEFSGRHDGLVITGAGREATVIHYAPEADGPLLWNNDAVLGLRISRITFRTDTPGTVWARFYSNGVSQDHHFSDITWRGSWETGVELVSDPKTGNPGNNNSEFLFDGILTSVYASRFVLLAGRASDQNLNYWIRNSKLWGWVTVVSLEKGGHVHVNDCDVSGYSPKAPNYLFELLGEAHAKGVCSLTIRGLRVEMKTADALLLRSEWSSGNIEISGLDLSSQTFRMVPAHPIIDILLGSGRGPIVSVRDSQFAGTIRVRNTALIGSDQALIGFERTTFHHGAGPDEVVVYEGSDAPRRIPDITFDGCRSARLADRGVWDCNLGFLMGGACHGRIRDLAVPADGGSIRFPKGTRIIELLDPATLAPVEGMNFVVGTDVDVPYTPEMLKPVLDTRPLSLSIIPASSERMLSLVLLRYLA